MPHLPAKLHQGVFYLELVSSLEPPGETCGPPPLSAAPAQNHRGCFQHQYHQVGIFDARRPARFKRGSAANMIGLAMLHRRTLAGLTPLVVFIAV